MWLSGIVHWGIGPQLGLLTLLGYIVVLSGVALLWRNRGDVFVWMLDEVGSFRRNLSRYTAIGPFYGIRSESRLKVVPAGFLRSITRFPRNRSQLAAALPVLGSALLILDFFI
jgi:hypothetical protein